MSLSVTVAALVLILGIGGLAAWRGARPWDPRRGPRMMPWRAIMVLSGALALYLAAHLLNLLGVTTGR